MIRSMQYLPLLLALLGLVGCQTMMFDPGSSTNAHGETTEGLFAKTSKLLRQETPQPPIAAALPPTLHVPNSSLSASQLLYGFGPPEDAEEPPTVADPVQKSPLAPQNDDSPKLRSLLVEIEATPPEKLGVSLTEAEKKVVKFREDRKNDSAAWLENPQIEGQYLTLLRKIILPPSEKPKESDVEEEAVARKPPVRRMPKEEPDEDLDEDDAPLPAPLPPAQKPKKETSVAASPPQPAYSPVTQLEPAPPAAPQSDIVLASYTAESPNGDWRKQTRLAADQLRTKIESSPNNRSFADEASLRLLELILGNRQEAVRPFPLIDKPINDFWSNQILGFSTLLDETGIPDQKSRLATASFRFDEGADELRRLCPMKLKNIQFVKDWVAFGVFMPRKEDCQAGETIGLYLELDNPTVKRSAIGYNVRASIHYEIRDSASRLVSKSKDIPVEETTPSQKRDYCIHVNVPIPKGLAHGQYLLRVSVTDMNSDNLQYAEEQLSFRILPSARSYPDE